MSKYSKEFKEEAIRLSDEIGNKNQRYLLNQYSAYIFSLFSVFFVFNLILIISYL